MHQDYKMQPTEHLTCDIPWICNCEGQGNKDVGLGESNTAANPNSFLSFAYAILSPASLDGLTTLGALLNSCITILLFRFVPSL